MNNNTAWAIVFGLIITGLTADSIARQYFKYQDGLTCVRYEFVPFEGQHCVERSPH